MTNAADDTVNHPKIVRTLANFRTNSQLLKKLDERAENLEISRNDLLNILVANGLEDERFYHKYTADFPLRMTIFKV